MDPTFQPGERITAHIPDLAVKRVLIDDDDVPWVYATYGEDMIDIALPVGAGIRFDRVTPADGEPGFGETWTDQVDELYFVYRDNGRPQLISEHTGLRLTWEQVHKGLTGPIYRVAQRPVLSQIEAGEATS